MSVLARWGGSANDAAAKAGTVFHREVVERVRRARSLLKW